MSPLVENSIEKIVASMSVNEAVMRIVVFGSQAHGLANATSDLDVLVIENTRFKEGHTRRMELSRLRQALRGIEMPVDLLLYSQEEVDRFKDSLNHVVAQALHHGKVVYER
jgi:predicted nucleotidyltransferase